ncbi:MAG: site-2 protease family protein [Planctomycetota bacterium]
MQLFTVFQVVFGIGLVIFVHEAGHYLAARWCGARVEVFSLGFGPRLFGWRRGDTLFQVAVVPLGGYVKVAGEYMEGPNREPEPGSLGTLSVPQRFLYYSGGVVMNVIFALVVLPFVMFAGLPAMEPVIGPPTPGMPAWSAGIPGGSRVLAVNDTDIVDFEHLVTAAALNGKKTARIEVLAPGAEGPRTYELEPKFDERVGFYRLGLPAGLAADRSIVVAEDSPAAKAGLATDDRLIAIEGARPELDLYDQLQRAFASREPIRVTVEGDESGRRTVEIVPGTTTLDVERIGVGAVGTRVAGVRSTGPAAALVAALGLQEDDDLVTVAGRTVWNPDGIRDALLESPPGEPLALQVRREGRIVDLAADLPDGVPAVRLLDDIALTIAESLSRVTVTPDSPAERVGMLDGDQVVSVNGQTIDGWESILESIQREVGLGRSIELEVWRDAVEDGAPMQELDLTIVAEAAQVPDYGFGLAPATTVLRADSLGGAVAMGVGATWRYLVDVWLQLKKMLFSSEISTKNLGGIISISVISADAASQGWARLFFLLAVLSINLAIINLLPIPILDGGHLLFLLIEGVKGSPVSERTFGYSQVVGLVMIMSLMVYVTYQDIVRWFIDRP